MKQYFSFQWHITDACDQRCKHCYIFSENSCKKIDSMDWGRMQETFYNCLDFCEVYGRGCPAVASGGTGNFYTADPQCWKDVG